MGISEQYVPEGQPKLGMVDQLQISLGLTEELVSQLSGATAPARMQLPESDRSSPSEAPTSPLHEQVLRLNTLNERLRVIIRELHL